jgi:hypothetical protein
MPSVPQLSLGSAALVIFAVCVGLVLLRGMARVLVGTLVLGVSAWLAFLVWQAAPDLSLDWTGKSSSAITLGLPAAAFLGAWFVLRKLAQFAANPFGGASRPRAAVPLTAGRLVFRLVFALIPSGLVGLIAVTVAHHAGAVAEIRSHAEQAAGLDEASVTRYFRDLRTAIEAVVPTRLLAYLDPQGEPARVAEAKDIADRSANEAPRAIILDEPELTQLARKGKYGDLLRHPVLTRPRPKAANR